MQHLYLGFHKQTGTSPKVAFSPQVWKNLGIRLLCWFNVILSTHSETCGKPTQERDIESRVSTYSFLRLSKPERAPTGRFLKLLLAMSNVSTDRSSSKAPVMSSICQEIMLSLRTLQKLCKITSLIRSPRTCKEDEEEEKNVDIGSFYVDRFQWWFSSKISQK